MSSDRHTVESGWSVQAGIGTAGWFAGVQVRPNRDRGFAKHLGELRQRLGAELCEGATYEAWREALLAPPELSVVLAREDGPPQTCTTAERLTGPAAAARTAAAALLAWTERRAGTWHLVTWRDGTQTTLAESPQVLCDPAVAEVAQQVFAACTRMGPDGPRVEVRGTSAEPLFEAPGRAPQLVAGDGALYLAYEAPDGSGCRLLGYRLSADGTSQPLDLPPGEQLDTLAHLTFDVATGNLWLVHESCPNWGHDHFLGRHRDLWLWRLDAGSDRFVAAPGRLPIPYAASHKLNRPPVQPRVLLLGDQPAVAFRRFEYDSPRPLNYHTYLTRFDGQRWTAPARLSRRQGLPELGYAVLADPRGLVAALIEHDQQPVLTADDLQAGRPPRSESPGNIRDTRVTVERLPADTDLGPVACLPNHVQQEYTLSLGVRDPSPEPPPLPAGAGAPKHLVWGDLHQHSLWSKCMSPLDGTRRENLRDQRHTLGCRVFSFGEHTSMMSDAEFTEYLDALEAEAGADGIALYGCEPWSDGHDTNLYALDREVFTRLRLLYLKHRPLGDILAAVEREFPDRQVACLRHFHGGGQGIWAVTHPEVVTTHRPAIEPAMEAMQVRGNVMVSPEDVNGAHPGFPCFPTNFLNAGCQVGLVGGSDHSGTAGPNHFCLTGFWVDEVTPEAIWTALWERRTIALANGRIAIWATCEGRPLGHVLAAAAPLRVHAWLSCARPITRATLLRDGQPLAWHEVGATSAELELVDPEPPAGAHWYSVTAEAESSPDLPRPVLGHASPFFTQP